jgi:hypothetical protein
VFGLPVAATVGWEYRVWKRKLYYERNRLHFPGTTPFYGKMWGYESDYMIDCSLQDGDLIFWCVDPLSIHIHEAICRFLYRHINGDYDAWDFCGVVVKQSGVNHVVGSNEMTVAYSDLVADHRTSSLAIRRLVDKSPAGESKLGIVSGLRMRSPEINVHVGPRGFLEASAKACIKRLSSGGQGHFASLALSLLRKDSMNYPLQRLVEDPPELCEIGDIFMSPLTNKILETSYSPPFYVRRFDNEYYNHNRTKNIVVDWELLTQRDLRNKLISENQNSKPEPESPS